MTNGRTLLGLLLILLGRAPALAEPPPPPKTVLDHAHELGTGRFQGWAYGEDAAKKQVDCVQFVEAVLEAARGAKVTPDASRAVRIQGLSTTPGDQAAIAKAVEAGDRRLAGVVHAIVDVLGEGVAVPFAEAKPGDFVQCWWRRERKEPDPADPKKTRTVVRWEGHAAIVESVVEADPKRKASTVRIYGSHRSLGGVGIAPSVVSLEDAADRRMFVARFTGPKAPK